MDDMQNKVEAVLFITGSYMTMEDIGKSAGIGSEGLVKAAVEGLKKSYDERNGSLEIIENEGKYKIALRKDYVQFSTKLLSSTELDRPVQETLAIIAYKQPILQADLIKVRGNGAYEHIHTLKEMQFIVSEKFGRTRKLKLAPKFFDYFDIAGDMLKAKCDEIGLKVGTVERIEKKDGKEQASLEEYNKDEKKEDDFQKAPSEENNQPEPSEPNPESIPPDPEDIQPEKPDVKDPKKKQDVSEEEPSDEPEEPDDNPDEQEEQAELSEDGKA
ncbi:MAG: SMC-Scp complex subunit ScpB [Candidatus Nanoarchaeia archaeon]|nr:SMC-Scp complex subunit ScpB [Candidatus Nanoarchaeia archaeon]